MQRSLVIKKLAEVFLASGINSPFLTSRCAVVLGRNWRWLRPLADRYVVTFSNRIRPSYREVLSFLETDTGLKEAFTRNSGQFEIKQWIEETPHMRPVPAAQAWPVPPIETTGALAEWLWLDAGHLEWYADLKAFAETSISEKLSHYSYHVLRKRTGSVRLIEAPKRQIKKLQTQILEWILNPVPPHPAVHGFIAKRSITTFVAPHTGQRVVLKMDLRNFFPSLRAARIQAFFRTAGYPDEVAQLLTGVCTNITPRRFWRAPELNLTLQEIQDMRDLYGRPHLPQGAPTSPALANLCAWRLDCRLQALAASAGAQYTRYADDLVFSGDEHFDRSVSRFSAHIGAVVLEEGFAIHHAKTRIMRQGQQQRVAGLVVNQHANVARPDYDRLKAILTNCIRHGPESQNQNAHTSFRQHLEGHISFVHMVNPAKALRLRALFDQIAW
ncbi:MAG: RNA-directed DNA polymerase [Bryobacteraceae bacterium]|nr:RNA-directed DNA polymerase [Bryobacteraceae bacterium]